GDVQNSSYLPDDQVWEDATGRLFKVSVAAYVWISSKSGKDVRKCHLKQDIVDDWFQYGDLHTKNTPKPNDIDSKNRGGDKDNILYGDWWFIDMPRQENQAPPNQALKTVPIKWFLQFHVTVEENSKVEIYYGLAVAANYKKIVANTDDP